ncbi:hypothetical protein MNBD_NITROSPINAE04-2019 [hydrothermal vent metagenome]|uniref:Uncharacterized protein n=1 Tax=hydrothermal vent metagenome TaxID=652676 RepID=A0A3B1CDT2_9ZZZZ
MMGEQFWLGRNIYQLSDNDKIPYQIPGPMDAWAGNEKKSVALPVHFSRDIDLSFEFADTHESHPPTLSVEIDGSAFSEIQVRPGFGTQPHEWQTKGKPQTIDIFIPAESIANEPQYISITTTSGSWVAISKVTLRIAPYKGELFMAKLLWGMTAFLAVVLAVIYRGELTAKARQLASGGITLISDATYVYPPQKAGWLSLLFTIGLLCIATYNEYPKWNVFELQPDSSSYIRHEVQRTYLYPLFIKIFEGQNVKDIEEYYTRGIIKPTADSPYVDLLRVVHAQKVILIITLLIFYFCLSLIVPCYLAFSFCLWLYLSDFFEQHAYALLTEPLSQSLYFITIGLLLCYLRFPRTFLALLMGLVIGLASIVRPANIFLLPFLIITLIGGVHDGYKKRILRLSAASAIVVIILLSQAFYTYYRTDSFMPSPMYPQQRIAIALQYATAEDIAAMPDSESVMFLKKCLELKKNADIDVIGSDRKANNLAPYEYYNSNHYIVASRLARSLFKSDHPIIKGNFDDKFWGYYSKLANKITPPILREHMVEWLETASFAFNYSNTKMSRISSSKMNITFRQLIPYMLIAFSLLLFINYKIATFCYFLLLAHLSNVALASLYNYPLERYIYATEWFVLVALFICISVLTATGAKLVYTKFCKYPEYQF